MPANTSVMFAAAAPVSKHKSVFINAVTVSYNNKPSQEIIHQIPTVILGQIILHGENPEELKNKLFRPFLCLDKLCETFVLII